MKSDTGPEPEIQFCPTCATAMGCKGDVELPDYAGEIARLRETLMRIEHAPKLDLRIEAERLGLGKPTVEALRVGYRSTHREASAYRGALVTVYKALATEALDATQDETP